MNNNLSSVLIVDDEDTILNLVYEELSGVGFICDLASDSEIALNKISKKEYDVAVLDIMLPNTSGLEILKTIKNSQKKTSVVIMTALPDAELAVKAMKLGASDYLLKPFTIDRLESSINNALKDNAFSHSQSESVDNQTNSRSNMEAIASGVEAQIDYFDFHSKIVTQKTVEIAKKLDIPPNEIEEWSKYRQEIETHRENKIANLLNRLEQNPLAQKIFGMSISTHRLPNDNNGLGKYN